MSASVKARLRGMRAFGKNYLKRYGVAAAVLSLVCLMMFFSAIIPADAVMLSEKGEYSQNHIGGVHFEKGDMNSAYDLSVPRNEAGERLKFVGNFKVTHYCACTICTWGSGITASGKPVAEGMIAADWRVLPKGTKVYLKKGDSLQEFVVEDRGGAINGNKIDVYVPSHDQALRMGVYYTDLYVDPDVDLP